MTINADLTVVIPAYNGERYVDGAMACAVSYAPGRILFGDDHSTDGTFAAAQRWQERAGPGLRVIRNPENLGMTGNWQHLFEQVETEFCLKLDVDDLLLADYVMDALDLLRRRPDVTIVAADARELEVPEGADDPGEAELAKLRWRHPEPQIMAGTAAAAFAARWDPYPSSASTIYRMAAWRAVGGYAESITFGPDQEIWFRLARLGSVAYYPEPAAIYRVLPTSVTRRWLAEYRGFRDLGRVYRSGRRIWPERELHDVFRRKLLGVAKYNFKWACRSGWRDPVRGLSNLGDCARHILWAMR